MIHGSKTVRLSILAILIGLAFACAGQPPVSHPSAAQAAAGPAPRPDGPGLVKEQIEDLLHRMTAAVLAADQPAYLACVSLDDPCFSTEQRNWAKDLGRHVPETFEASLADDPELEPDGAAAAHLKMAWRMPGGRERTLTCPVRFVHLPGGWRYAGEKWNVVEAEGVRVLYEGDLADAARRVAEVLPGVRAHVHEGFGLENDADITKRTQEVKLYTTMRHLQQSIYLSYSDSLSGWNEPGESIKLLTRANPGKTGLGTLLAHEYGHVATFQLGLKATDMPWWVLEGVAELAAQDYSHDWSGIDAMVRRWARTERLVDWDRLADFRGEATQHTLEVYTQGHHMLGYISERFGREGRNRWLRAMAQGASLDRATRDALGLPFAELDAEWRASVMGDEEVKR